MDIKELFKTAPEGATHVSLKSPVLCWYKDVVEGVSYSFMNSDMKHWLAAEGVPRFELTPRPVDPQPVKSLEQRIIDRAHDRLQSDVEMAMLQLRALAKGVEHDQSGIQDMTISQAIGHVGAAIVRLRKPAVANKALDRALEELAEKIDPSWRDPRQITPRS